MSKVIDIIGKVLGSWFTMLNHINAKCGEKKINKQLETILDEQSPYKVFATPEIPQQVFPVYMVMALDQLSGGGPTYRHARVPRGEEEWVDILLINQATAELGDDVIRSLVLREVGLILNGGIAEHNKANAIELEYQYDSYAAEKGYGLPLIKFLRASREKEYYPTKFLKACFQQWIDLRIQNLIKVMGY